MKCKCCGAEIIRIQTMGGPVVCWASPVTYWSARNSSAHEVLTPNGEHHYGNLSGELQRAIGVGYLPHTCNQLPLIFEGRDSWDRPVYQGLDGKRYVDIDPRKGRKPNICTKLSNAFDGEPCNPVEATFDFIPHRDTW